MSRARTSSAAELLVTLRRDDDVPLHRQLEQELRTAIRSGRLAAHSPLPSTRALADQLGLSRGVVVEAYEQLVAEGYLLSRPGGVTRVCAAITDSTPSAVTVSTTPAHRIDFTYGRPDVTQFPRQVWLRSLRRVLNESPSDHLASMDTRGAAELRGALADYLNRVRATTGDPERMVICNGFAQALALVVQVLKDTGRRQLAVEDPGQDDTPMAARRHGLGYVPVPVDERGIVVDALERTTADAVAITPAHHFPTGAVLSADRRAELVAWAKRRQAFILEDDYDAEYRYDREPIGAVQGLAPEHVIYAGSASKTLAPGLRLGWLIAPTELVERIAAAKELADRGSPVIEQLAFADFLARGEFDHHLRRMRPVYRRRRDVLLRALERHLPDVRPTGASAGLHIVAWLPPDVDEQAVVERAATLGVGAYGLSKYRTRADVGPGGLLFGYGRLTEGEIEEGIHLIAQAVREIRLDRAKTPELALSR
jgi:GntR family transcriptional regulator/MocR family aminotransferase